MVPIVTGKLYLEKSAPGVTGELYIKQLSYESKANHSLW